MVVAVPELPLRSPTAKLSSLVVSVRAQSEGLGVRPVGEMAVAADDMALAAAAAEAMLVLMMPDLELLRPETFERVKVAVSGGDGSADESWSWSGSWSWARSWW